MSYTPRYDKGSWITTCDVCGRRYKSNELIKRWDGLMCCPDDWEIRQPQDFVRGVADTQVAPWVRPEPQDSFIPFLFTTFLNFLSSSAVVLLTQYIEGGAHQYIFVTSTASLTAAKRFPITGGARQLNGSALNTNSLG